MGRVPTAMTWARLPAFVGGLTVFALSSCAGLFGSLLLGPVSLIAGPVAAGIVCSALISERRLAGALSAAAGAGGALSACLLVSIGPVARPLVNTSTVILAGPLMSTAAGVMLALVAAALAAIAYDRFPAPPILRHLPAVCALAIVVVALTLRVGSGGGFSPVQVAEAGSYSTDEGIYRQTLALMVHDDLGYYEAIVEAAAGDARLIAEGAVVDGRFRGWATTPAFIRLPYLFGLWESAVNLGVPVIALALALAAVLLLMSYWALVPRFGPGAVAAPLLLHPWFAWHANAANLYMPDFWAGMLALGALFCAIRERWVPAALFALAAALCRNVAAVWLVFLIVAALHAWLATRERRAGRDLAVYLAAAAVFAVLTVAHERPAAAVISPEAVPIGALDMLAASAGRSLSQRFLVPAEYLMLPYGSLLVPAASFLLAAPAGFALALRGAASRVLVTVLAASLFWLGFTALIGATSSYWGQQYTALGLFGTFAMLLWLAETAPGARVRATHTETLSI